MRAIFLTLVLLGALLSTASAQLHIASMSDSAARAKLYTIVEQEPRFGAGREDALAFLAIRTQYPAQALQDRVQGTVVIGFTVGSDGHLTQVRVLSGAHPLLDAEALRVVQQMPPWQPGIQNGKPTSMAYSLPVTFQIGPAPRQGKQQVAAPYVAARKAEYSGSAEELNARLNFPAYPAEARALQQEGRVVVFFDVDSLGRVINVETLQPLAAQLQKTLRQQPQPSTVPASLQAAAAAAIQALPAWKPATLHGQSVLSHNMVVVDYRLQARPDTVYHLAEFPAVFPGGEGSLGRYLERKINYPAAAWRERVQGEVLVYFVINKAGRIEAPEILQSVHPALDAEALRVVRGLPAFMPATHQGRAVKTSYLLPIGFIR